jgi:hypothetical protein
LLRAKAESANCKPALLAPSTGARSEPAEHGSARILVYEECGNESPPDALGWRAFLLADENRPLYEVAMFCPECAERSCCPGRNRGG